MTPKSWRRRKGSDTWHFMPKCSNWPKSGDYEEQVWKPESGELCDQCKAKRKHAPTFMDRFRRWMGLKVAKR